MTQPAPLVSERLTAAKLWLVSEPASLPGAPVDPSVPRALSYLAHALFALVPVSSTDVERLGVDEQWRLYVNPSWLAESGVPEIGAELAHVTWHLLRDHAARARDVGVDAATADPWTQASDATVADTLAPDALNPAALPDAGSLGLPTGRSAEEYFAMLSRLPVSLSGETTGASSGTAPGVPGGASEEGPPGPREGCGSGCDGLPRSHELPSGAEVGGLDGEEGREIRRRVAIAYREHVTARGTEPGDAWRWATDLLEPRVPWEQVLSGAVRRAVGWAEGRTDPTYSRPSRRSGTVRDVVLPGMRRPLPRVAMVVDTSGSVDDGLLARALGEVDGALRAVGVRGDGVTVLSCDAAVHTVDRVRRARDVRVAGGGGTDMRLGLAEAERLRPRPDLVVVLTDGYTPWPDAPPPGSAVIVALLGREHGHLPPTPEWAVRVECLLD